MTRRTLNSAPRDSRTGLAATALTVVVILLFYTSLTVGAANIGWWQISAALFSGAEVSDAIRLIVWEIRVPRSLLGVFVGAALGMSGAALQGYLRNPLAEPGLLGVSSGAALGAVIALYSGLSSAFAFALPLMGLLGAVGAVLAVYLLAGAQGRPLTLILAGVAVSAFSGALISLALNLAPNPFAALEVIFWMMGSLADRSMDHVQLAAPLILIGLLMQSFLGPALDALTLGEDVAMSLGVNLARTQALLVCGVAFSVGAATSVTGVIGFVGLVAPHLLRPLVRARPSRLLFLSALAGACIVLAADITVRFFGGGTEMKLGVLTALVGAPFFLGLILKTRRELLT